MRKNKKGFTLVELVIVIAVIAILAAVLLPTFAGIVSRARFSSVTQRAEAVRKEVLGQYFDTAADMGDVEVLVKNDDVVYLFKIATADANGVSTGKWTATDMTSTKNAGTGASKTLADTDVSQYNFYRFYGEDVLVIIPENAHFGTNVSLKTGAGAALDEHTSNATITAVPEGLTQK